MTDLLTRLEREEPMDLWLAVGAALGVASAAVAVVIAYDLFAALMVIHGACCAAIAVAFFVRHRLTAACLKAKENKHER